MMGKAFDFISTYRRDSSPIRGKSKENNTRVDKCEHQSGKRIRSIDSIAPADFLKEKTNSAGGFGGIL